MAEHVRQLRDGDEGLVPGAWIADAGPQEGARVRLWLGRDGQIVVTVLSASGTFPAVASLPLERLEETLQRCKADVGHG
jgi:hypothetical protein